MASETLNHDDIDLEPIEILKQQGNDFFRLEQYDEAKLSYSEALAELIAPMNTFQNSMVEREVDKDPITNSMLMELYQIKSALLGNRGFCYLKLKQWENCIRDLTQCLLLVKGSSKKGQDIFMMCWFLPMRHIAFKAYFRRALAMKALGNYAKAFEDCLGASIPFSAGTGEDFEKRYPQWKPLMKSLLTENHRPLNIDIENLDYVKQKVVLRNISWEQLEITNKGPTTQIDGFTVTFGPNKNLIYYLGGRKLCDGPIDQFWELNIEKRTWRCLKSNIGPRNYHTIVNYENSMYVFGGVDIYCVENADYLDCLWQFCFTTKKWTPIRKPKQPKFLTEHAALVKGNKMYVFGGEFKSDRQSNSLYEFNFLNKKWKKLSGGTSKTFNVGAPEIRKRALFWCSKNYLYVAGGIFYREDQPMQPDYALNDCWKFNLETKTWEMIEQFGNLPCRRTEFSQAQIDDNCVFMFGGYNQSLSSNLHGVGKNKATNSFSYFNDSFIFQSNIQTWLMIQPDGIKPRLRACAGCLFDNEKGMLYLIGGYLGGAGLSPTQFNDVWSLKISDLRTPKPVQKCGNCEKTSFEVRLLSCSGCGKIQYCSKYCMEEHWKFHKENCDHYKNKKQKKKRKKKKKKNGG